MKDQISLITDKIISWDELELELKSTRNNKATGNDNLPSELYKLALNNKNSNFAKSILLIFNKI